MAIFVEEKKMWDPGLFDDPPRIWQVSSVGALLHWGDLLYDPYVLTVLRAEEDVWGLPAGRIEPEDKTAEEGVAREVLQETGLEIGAECFKLLLQVNHPKNLSLTRLIFSAPIDYPTWTGLGAGNLSGEINLYKPNREVRKIAMVRASDAFTYGAEIAPTFKPDIWTAVRLYLGYHNI